MELAAAYTTAVQTWTAQLGVIGPEHWDLPTPCSEWNVRALVNHVVGEDLWTVPLLEGQRIEEVGDRFDGDVLGSAPVATALQAAGDALGAALPSILVGGTVHLSYGEETVGEYLSQLLADHLVHAWDLAAALGMPAAFDDDLVAHVAAWFSERESLYRSFGIIAEAVPVDADAGPAEKLIAAFGRDPAWGR